MTFRFIRLMEKPDVKDKHDISEVIQLFLSWIPKESHDYLMHRYTLKRNRELFLLLIANGAYYSLNSRVGKIMTACHPFEKRQWSIQSPYKNMSIQEKLDTLATEYQFYLGNVDISSLSEKWKSNRIIFAAKYSQKVLIDFFYEKGYRISQDTLGELLVDPEVTEETRDHLSKIFCVTSYVLK